jgi:hypothetical protein
LDDLKSKNRRISSVGVTTVDREMRCTIFPGQPGPLESDSSDQFLMRAPTREELIDMAFMFNFNEDVGILGSNTICLQVNDSEWSRSFSLDSVGVNQQISAQDVSGNVHELGFKISMAQGRLGNFTKIVRFWPRFVLVNTFPVSVKIWQHSSIRATAQAADMSSGLVRVTEVPPDSSKTFHLPTASAARKLCIEVSEEWQRSVSFSIDEVQDCTLRVQRKIDPSLPNHVVTRSAAEYDVEVKGEIGLWLETDWNHKDIVVKECKKGNWSPIFNEGMSGRRVFTG